MSDRPLSEQVRKARKADVDLGLLGDEIAALEAERDRLRGWIETRPCTCVESASSDGKVWLMQRCSRCTALAPIFDMRALAALEGGDDGCS